MASIWDWVERVIRIGSYSILAIPFATYARRTEKYIVTTDIVYNNICQETGLYLEPPSIILNL